MFLKAFSFIGFNSLIEDKIVDSTYWKCLQITNLMMTPVSNRVENIGKEKNGGH